MQIHMQDRPLSWPTGAHLCCRSRTCAALDGPDGGGRCAWWGGRQQEQRPPSLSFLVPRAALVNGAHVAVAAHPEAPGHWQRVHGFHAVYCSLHGLGLHRAVDLLTHLLDLPVHLQLTQLEEDRGRTSEGGAGRKQKQSHTFIQAHYC